jgi:predicted transcriptional regulator
LREELSDLKSTLLINKQLIKDILMKESEEEEKVKEWKERILRNLERGVWE